MPLPSSGAISLANINTEFGRAAAANVSLSQLYRGAGIVTQASTSVPTAGTISLANFYGVTNAFVFNQTISGTTLNYNLKQAAINAGWNQSIPLIANITIGSGVVVGASNTGVWAFDTGVGFPAGSQITITNYGYICGAGGAGGGGGSASFSNTKSGFVFSSTGGSAGGGGGPALLVQTPVTIYNYAYIFGGGGGGGGGGGYAANTKAGATAVNGSGGGGGAGYYSGGGGGPDGGAGGVTGGGTAGTAGVNGGNGGGMGGNGAAGATGTSPGGGGGGYGRAVYGNGYVTWGASGYIYGIVT